MNRTIGLNDKNCNFYTSGLEKLSNLGDEIEHIIKNIDKNKIQYNKTNIRKLFNDNHSYEERWKLIINKINRISK